MSAPALTFTITRTPPHAKGGLPVIESTDQYAEVRQILRHCPFGVAVCRLDGTLEYVSPEARRLLELTGARRPITDLFRALRDVLPDLSNRVAGAEVDSGPIVGGATFQVGGGDGPRAFVELTLIRTAHGMLACVLADVSARVASEERLRKLESRDSLTGLETRRRFFEVAGRALGVHGRYNVPVTIVCVALDGLRAVNETHGFEAGDQALVQLAAACRAECRAVDFVARMGGTKAGIVLPHTNAADAEVLAERLREHVATSPLQLGGATVELTVSIGLAQAQMGVDKGGAFLGMAEEALEQARGAGGNRVVVYSSAKTDGQAR